MHNECTEQQRAFCREYIIDWNGTKAAIRAKYAESHAHTQATHLLKIPKVRAEINRLLNEVFASDKEEIKGQVLDTLKRIAQHDISEFIEIKTKTVNELVKDFDGNMVQVEVEKQVAVIRDTAGIDTRAVSSIKQNEKGVIEIKFHDPLKASELLGRYTGMWVEKLELSGSIDISDPRLKKMTADELREELRKLEAENGNSTGD